MTSISLLTKIGNLSNMSIWLSILLIITSIETFTRKMYARVIQCERQLTNSYKTRFIHRYFFAGDSLFTDLVEEYARRPQLWAVGLLLNKKKKDYSRVKSGYLLQMALPFSLPQMIVHSLLALLFAVKFRLRSNSFLSSGKSVTRPTLS